MTRTLRGSVLIGSMLVVTWATASEACGRRRACAPVTYCNAGYTYAGSTGYYGGGGGSGMAGGAYYGGGYTGYPGGYGTGQPGYAQPGYAQPGYAQPGYNPGGLGGPASGLGVRPGLGVGGFGPGR
jgi:hypothetical protein